MGLRVGYIFKNRVREGCLRSWQQRGRGVEPALCPSRKRALYSLHRGTMAQQWAVMQKRMCRMTWSSREVPALRCSHHLCPHAPGCRRPAATVPFPASSPSLRLICFVRGPVQTSSLPGWTGPLLSGLWARLHRHGTMKNP